MNKDVLEFINSMKKTASFSYENIKYKYPYKPAICIAIFDTLNIQIAFNYEIDFKKYETNNLAYKIVKKYYDLLTSDYDIYEIIKNQMDKNITQEFSIGFNKTNYSRLVKHIFEMPLGHLLQNDFFKLDSKNKKIIFKIENDDFFAIKKLIINTSFQKIKICIPQYAKFNNIDELLNYSEILENDLIVNPNIIQLNQKYIDELTKMQDEMIENKYYRFCRKYQHVFSKFVKDRDQKCIICCEEYPGLLDAAHIKPFGNCKNAIEQYDFNNGITLCKTHHKLFDLGFFTFNSDWTIKLSKSKIFTDYDLELKFKTHEPCFTKINSKFAINDTSTKYYLEYHHSHIFKQ